MGKSTQELHDARAPYWAAALVVFCSTGLATIWVPGNEFWKGYVLDIMGPAWNYILFRRLSHKFEKNRWTVFFNPFRTLIIFIFVCYGIELMQYFQVYDSTYDPWDLIAYVSLLIPLFLIDVYLTRSRMEEEV